MNYIPSQNEKKKKKKRLFGLFDKIIKTFLKCWDSPKAGLETLFSESFFLTSQILSLPRAAGGWAVGGVRHVPLPAAAAGAVGLRGHALLPHDTELLHGHLEPGSRGAPLHRTRHRGQCEHNTANPDEFIERGRRNPSIGRVWLDPQPPLHARSHFDSTCSRAPLTIIFEYSKVLSRQVLQSKVCAKASNQNGFFFFKF